MEMPTRRKTFVVKGTGEIQRGSIAPLFRLAWYSFFRVSSLVAVLPSLWGLPEEVPFRRCIAAYGTTIFISMKIRGCGSRDWWEHLKRSLVGIEMFIGRSPWVVHSGGLSPKMTGMSMPRMVWASVSPMWSCVRLRVSMRVIWRE